ncbi:hypothetical protein EAI_10240 [Harpegnathos saltator]|uniref:ER-bound oxygenase mpaB/mpaB'/Rubber oxygenase catalytic domain-containing protein n=2 Tax=Harpegnathos saltator TaxID=610380 RepID=E2BKV5_HARSA|nr:hypothetical protein EAI_10240 [Harpegnathos saltator]
MNDVSEIDYEHYEVTPKDLPDWYDEKLCKLSQDFCLRNIFSFITANTIGVIILFAIPSISKVLSHTKQGNTPYLAYMRYYRTMLYVIDMHTYNMGDPESKFYKAIKTIRFKHAWGNNKAKKNNSGAIYQKDMAITQFAFIGHLLCMSESFGVHFKPEEEKAFIHFWRVVGHILGISDRINICRKSVAETRELLQMIIDKFSEYLSDPSPEFDELLEPMLSGLWYGNLSVNQETLLTFTYRFYNVKREVPLGWYSWLNMKYHEIVFRLLLVPYIGPILKIFINQITFMTIFFVRYLPLIAWISFGKKKSQIVLYPK